MTADELKSLDDKILDSIDVEWIESEVLKNCELYPEIEDSIVAIDKSLKDCTKEVVTENPKGSINGAVSKPGSTTKNSNICITKRKTISESRDKNSIAATVKPLTSFLLCFQTG